MNNILPLLSPYLSSAIAIKAISKQSPKMKDFINRSLTYGYGADMVIDFLRSVTPGSQPTQYEGVLGQKAQAGKLTPDETLRYQQMQQGQQMGSAIPKAVGLMAGVMGGGSALPIVESVASMLPGGQGRESTVSHEAGESAPTEANEDKGVGHNELHGLIMQHLNQGRSPLEAGALIGQMADTKAYSHLKSPIRALEKQHNMKFPDIVAKLYQSAMQKTPMQAQSAQQQQPPEIPQGQLGQQGQPPAIPQQAQGGMPGGFQMPQPGTPQFGEFAKEFMRLKKNTGLSR